MKNAKEVEILILAGGRGTRLATVVSDVPKPMAPIQDKPFLEYLINSVKKQGFYNFRLLVGYKSEVIKNYFGDGSTLGVNIHYTLEEMPLGTGGAVKKGILDSTFDNFLIFNGDTFFEADLPLLISESKDQLAIALKYFENCERYGQVIIDNNFKIKSFREKGNNSNDGFINAGIYYFSRSVLDHFPPEDVFSIEQAVMPKLVEKNLLTGIPLGGKFIDIGIPEDFKKAQTFLDEFKFIGRQPALFLDRDGIVIKDSGYVSKTDEIEFYPDIIPIIKYANSKKIPVCIVTNQAGVARGYFTIEQCNVVNNFIIDELKKQEAYIDYCYVCPYHPTAGIGEFTKDSLLRKPNPGMILKAQEDISIDIKKSRMIGDKVSDIIHLPGLKTILIKRNYDLSKAPPDAKIYNDLQSAFEYIKNEI